MSKAFPALKLDYHNDQTSVKLSVDILLDNFVVCDLESARCIFEKYSSEFYDESKRLHCIPADAWRAMVETPHLDYRTTLLRVGGVVRGHVVDGKQVCTRTFKASRLRTTGGRHVDGEIVAESRDGVLFFGPYIKLARGRYLAAVNANAVRGPGTIILKVTLNGGSTVLAQRRVSVAEGSMPDLQIAFDVVSAEVSELEVVCTIKDLGGIAVSGITISERTEPDAAPPSRWGRLRSALPRGVRNGTAAHAK